MLSGRLGGGDDGADDGASAVVGLGLEAQLGESDNGLCVCVGRV